MRHEVRGDGVRADDDQRKRDAAMLADIDDPGKCREKEKADAAAEQRPRGSPDFQIPVK
jgi:hypothetical protein